MRRLPDRPSPFLGAFALCLAAAAPAAGGAPELRLARDCVREGSAQKVVLRKLAPSEAVDVLWIDPSSRVRGRWRLTADREGDASVEFALEWPLHGAHRVIALREGDAASSPSAEATFLVLPAELPPYLLVLVPEGDDVPSTAQGNAASSASSPGSERASGLSARPPPGQRTWDLAVAVAGPTRADTSTGWVARPLEGGPQFLRLDRSRLAALEAAYARTGSEELLVRPVCLHDRAWLEQVRLWALPRFEAASRRGPLLWSLGRGDFLAEEGGRLDFCRSPHCLRAFAAQLARTYGYPDALARRWGIAGGTSALRWSEISPISTAALLGVVRGKSPLDEDFPSGAVAQWSDHRRFLDRTWAETLSLCREMVRSADRRAAKVGVEALSMPGIFSGAEPRGVLEALDWASLPAAPAALALGRSLARGAFCAMTELDGPGFREALWRGVVHGHRGAFLSARDFASLGPADLRALERLSGELGALLERASWEPDPVAVLYSHPSVQLDWILSAAGSAGPGEGRPAPSGAGLRTAGAAFAAWTEILSDIGISARIVDVDGLSRSALARCAALILPRSLVLSSREAQECARFARSGGLVVADSGAGLLDGGFVRPRRPALDEVFGIERRGARLDVDRVLSLPGAGKRGAYVDGVDPRHLRLAEGGVAAAAGFALAEGEGSVGLVTNPFGRGRGAYLNLVLDEYPTSRAGEEGASLRRLIRNVLDLARVRPRVEVLAGGRPLDGCERSFLRLEETEIVVLHLDRELAASPVQAELVFDGPGYCYDALAGVLLGSGERIKVRLVPGSLSVFTRLPYDVEGISISAQERAGGRVRFRAVVETTTGLAWTHMLRQELWDSRSRRVPGASATLLAARGIATGEVRFALNEPAGEYRLVLRDAATGVTGELTLTRRPGDLDAALPAGGGVVSAPAPGSGGSPDAGSAAR